MLELITSKRYKITYKSDTQRLNRQAVMVYLDEYSDHYLFSARPLAGTQKMPKSWIISIEEVDPMTTIYINRIAKDQG